MFHNYFFLKRLAEQLDKKISSFSLQACFSQNRDELILHFVKENSSFFIRANLDPNISLLAFPEHFARANRNSVDLFQSVISKKVIHIETFRYERSFAIVFEDEVKMIFKMHGRRSNILLVEKEKVVDIFRKSLHPDWDVDPSTLNKKVTITQELFQNHRENPLEMLPAIGKETKIYWEQRKYFEMEPEEKWILFEQTLNKLETNPIFLIDSNLPRLSLLNEEDRGTTNALMAANWLYDKVSKRFYVERDKKNIIGQLKQKIKRSENYISKTLRKLNEIKNSRSPEEIANILMANLHAIQTGMTKVVLHDLYSNQPISIPLKVNLSPQKNAEVYYRKSKNRHREIEILKRNIHQKEKLIEQLSAEILRVDSIENPKELRKQTKGIGEKRTEKIKKQYLAHCKEVIVDGWVILVGKNAKSNDELTLKIAKKNDLWLHAKDVSGSHVVVKERPGQNFPNHIIEIAAGLAAGHSKRKTDSICPVIYTKKKFVRKTKGSLAGQVVVEREEIVMVEPILEKQAIP